MNFSRLDRFLDELYRRYGVPACELIVNYRYERIYHRLCGYSDVKRTVPASDSDIYWLYSETKLFTVVAVMQLYEKLLIDLDETIYKWLPEFEDMMVRGGRRPVPAKNAITVRRLLNMTVGLGYNVDSAQMIRLAGTNVSTREGVKALAEQPMLFEPGTHFMYNLCHDVLAAMVERVSGLSFGEYLKRNIFDPLGITELSFSAEELIKRGHTFSAQYRYDEKTRIIRPVAKVNRYRLGKNYQSGGAGLCGTCRDYIKLPQALANGGISETGQRILRPETIDLIRTNQMTNGILRGEFNRMKSCDYTYGLGVRVRTFTGHHGIPVGEFGWDGAAGAYNLIDTDNNISIHYVQHVLDPYSWCDGLHMELRETIYEGLRL